MRHKKVFTREDQVELRKLAELGLTMAAIAHHFGVSKDTLERMYKTTNAVRAAINRGRALSLIKTRSAILRMALTAGPNQLKGMKLWFTQIESIDLGDMETQNSSKYLGLEGSNDDDCTDQGDDDPDFLIEVQKALLGLDELIRDPMADLLRGLGLNEVRIATEPASNGDVTA